LRCSTTTCAGTSTSCGGFTQCAKIAGLAAGFNVPLANGGAWPYHNMHLQAGVAIGGLVEMRCESAPVAKSELFENGFDQQFDGEVTGVIGSALPRNRARRQHRMTRAYGSMNVTFSTAC